MLGIYCELNSMPRVHLGLIAWPVRFVRIVHTL